MIWNPPELLACYRSALVSAEASAWHHGSDGDVMARGAVTDERIAVVARSTTTITTFSELTIDGRLTLANGSSSKELFAFYGAPLQRWFHQQRAAHDAIMVGAGTVRADNPQLTVRHVEGRNPLRVVPTNDGALPPESYILTDGQPTLLAVPDDLPADAVARLERDSVTSDALRAGPGLTSIS